MENILNFVCKLLFFFKNTTDSASSVETLSPQYNSFFRRWTLLESSCLSMLSLHEVENRDETPEPTVCFCFFLSSRYSE